MKYNDIIAALDIGSSNICAMIAEYNEHNELEVIGVSSSASKGIRNGAVINIEDVQESIQSAVEEAERMANREINTVITNISGVDIRGINSKGVVAVNAPGREITQEDLDRVLESARAKTIPLGHEIVHLLPQMYIVDDEKSVSKPLNMIGTRLEAAVHLITASTASAQNVISSINRAGFTVSAFMYQNLASIKATLTNEERNIGCLFLNIGGATTDIMLFIHGAPQYTCVLPIGGIHVTSDLSIILKIPMAEAEKLKLSEGFAYSPSVDSPDSTIIIPGIAGRTPISTNRRTLCSYIEPRMQEIFELIKKQIEKEVGFSAWHELGGLVLCGGAAMLPGSSELAESVFSVSARSAVPIRVQGLVKEVSRPDRATAFGLILQAAENLEELYARSNSREHKHKTPGKLRKWFGKLRNAFF